MKRIFAFLSLLFTTQSVLSDYITQNIPNACNINKQFFTHFTINSYTCNFGEYLPAHSLGCSTCPSGYTCNGGTYNFNDTEFQGAIKSSPVITQSLNDLCAANSHKKFLAKYTPNQHNCSAGYYLPANTDECRPCLKDNKCIGGTYSFNETNDQGIEPCPNDNKYAPSHSVVCYPRRMHIDEGIYVYLKSTPSTDPALNVNVNGMMYHANLVRDEIPMNKDTNRFLPVTINGVMYFACDDTSCPQ